MPDITQSLPERVITPKYGIDALLEALSSLWFGFAGARALAWRFFLRDTRAAHRQSLLGYTWLVVPPLANTLVWVFLNGQNIVRIDTGNVPYPIFVLAGTVVWGAFNATLVAMLAVVNETKGILSKVNFPHESLIYCALMKSALEATLPLLLMVPAVFIFKLPWNPSMLLFPLAIPAAMLLGAAVGILAIPVSALYPDVTRIIHLGLRFGFFVTPVVFALPREGIARAIMAVNPLTPIIVSGRAWLAGAGESMPLAFCAIFLACLALAALGLVFFKVTIPHIIERLSG